MEWLFAHPDEGNAESASLGGTQGGGGSADEAEVVGSLKSWVGAAGLFPADRQEPPTTVRCLPANVI